MFFNFNILSEENIYYKIAPIAIPIIIYIVKNVILRIEIGYNTNKNIHKN